MAEEAWGVKRVCPETGKRFYDLNKDPIVSPYTDIEYELSFFTNDKTKTSMTDTADKANVAEATEDDLTDEVDVLDAEVGAVVCVAVDDGGAGIEARNDGDFVAVGCSADVPGG